MNTHPVITEFRELFTTNNPDMGKRFVDSMQEEAIESFILTALSKQREEFLGMIDEIEEMIKRVYKDRKSTRLNSSHSAKSRMPSSA